MNVLVTGGTGFIGIHVVRKLLEQGDQVICLTRSELDETSRKFLHEGEKKLIVERAEIENADRLTAIIEKYQVQRIVHAAAVTPSPEEEKENPEKVIRINFNGTLNVLNAARLNHVERVVYLSSNGIYGNIARDDERVTEDHALCPQSLYSIAKISSEMVCKRFQEMYGMRVVTGRIGSAYGPMERPTQSRKNMSVLNRIVQFACANQELRVKGTGSARNWTHGYDLAGAISALLKTENLTYPVYNLAYGKNYSIAAVLQTIKNIHPSFDYRFVAAEEPADMDLTQMEGRGILDNSRLLADTGFKPIFDLEKGLRQYREWLDCDSES